MLVGGGIFNLSGKFVMVMEIGVEGIELVVTAVVLPIWGW